MVPRYGCTFRRRRALAKGDDRADRITKRRERHAIASRHGRAEPLGSELDEASERRFQVGNSEVAEPVGWSSTSTCLLVERPGFDPRLGWRRREIEAEDLAIEGSSRFDVEGAKDVATKHWTVFA